MYHKYANYLQDQTFPSHTTEFEYVASHAFVSVMKEFIGNTKTSNYWDLILRKSVEELYQGWWGTHMVADYCWCLMWDCHFIQ